MVRGHNIIGIVAITIVMSCILVYLLHEFTGWISFEMNNNQNFMLNDNLSPNKVSRLYFKNCIYTVSLNGIDKVQDVSSVLNNMVLAYKDNSNPNFVFKLDDPGLSPTSFIVDGYNDKTNHPSSEWINNAKVTLVGKYKLLK